MQPIFSDNFLSHYLVNFKASSIPDIRSITLEIEALINDINVGKTDSLKEEEIKSRFVTIFFGHILGFNYGNSTKWQLREEKKSVTNGTKTDAALGYFFINKSIDDVRAVIEIKDANTDLDEKQKRENSRTPIEQAFDYASNMGGKCKWVIVSNMKEVRFYPSLDRSKCQIFKIEELANEKKRNELLFLFHKDRFIKENDKSYTDILFEKAKSIQRISDKPIHIIDKIYNSVKKFDGLGFVDPNYLCTIYPFNILDDYVWHYHSRYLMTINSEIYFLIKNIDIKDNKIIFNKALTDEINNAKVIDAQFKLETSFKFLNNCLITKISAVRDYQEIRNRNKHTIGFSHEDFFSFKEGDEGITKDIDIISKEKCTCMSCSFKKFNFKLFLSKLKLSIGNERLSTLEYAYGHYIVSTDNRKTTYLIYKTLEKRLRNREGKEIDYFLTKYNIKLLYNLIHYYDLEDKKEILNDIKNIDLVKVIYDEIEFNVDKDVKEYLVQIKEDELIYKLQDKIEEYSVKIQDLKIRYDDGGTSSANGTYVYAIYDFYLMLHLHINKNYIIYNSFSRYKQLTEKVFKGLITSSLTPSADNFFFNDFILTEAILHIHPNSLKKILENTVSLKIQDDTKTELIEKLTNFLSSYYEEGIFEPYENKFLKEYLNYFGFKEKFTDIFTNLFIILNKIEINKVDFQSVKRPLLKFLKLEQELAWFDLEKLGQFLLSKGDLFEDFELKEIIDLCIKGLDYGKNKYNDLLEKVCKSLSKYYPSSKVNNQKLIERALINTTSDDGTHNYFNNILCLYEICDEKCRILMTERFEGYLDSNFSCHFYENLLRHTSYDYEKKDYFQKYVASINTSYRAGAYKYGKFQLTDLIYYNFIILIYKREVDLERDEFKSLTNINLFEKWLLNPSKFDYNHFEAKWLMDVNNQYMLSKIKGMEQIRKAIDIELDREFNAVLAEIKYKHFKY